MNSLGPSKILLLIFIFHYCAAGLPKCQIETLNSPRSRYEKLLDPSVRPCTNFHGYACGNWQAPLSGRLLRVHDTLSELKADNKMQLFTFLFEAVRDAENSTLPLAEKRTVKFYNSCLTDLIIGDRKVSIQPFIQLLRQLSKWPIIDDDFSEQKANVSFNWQLISAKLRHYGVQSFWQLRVQQNWQAAEQRIFYLTAPEFDLLKPHKLASSYDDDSVYLYERYVKYLCFDLNVRVRSAIKIATEIVEFEQELFALATPSDTVILREPQTLASLVRELPELQLFDYFKILLEEFNVPDERLRTLLVAADKTYLHRLGRFLRTAKAEIIGKWLLVQLLAHFEFHMHDDSSLTEQKDHCLQQLNTLLPNELSAVFFNLQLEKSAENVEQGELLLKKMQLQLNEIFERLKVQFERLLNATKIFADDALSKVLGLEKLRAMKLLLPQINRLSELGNRYEVTDNYTINLINLARWHVHEEFKEVLQLPALTSSRDAATSYGPLHVNAYYRLRKNAIEIPIGVLRLPLYHRCMSHAQLYGGLGYMLAHELLHGFDYDGLNYDKTGNLAGNVSAKSIIQFGLKSQCYLSERYTNAYPTINENIADSEGLRLALEATLMEDMDAEVAGLVAGAGAGTTRQEHLRAFFISFAQVWCGSNANANDNINSVSSTTAANPRSVHSNHEERVNNAVGNFEEFAEAFQCQPENVMNPANKCRIW